jgi:hypothetical protein
MRGRILEAGISELLNLADEIDGVGSRWTSIRSEQDVVNAFQWLQVAGETQSTWQKSLSRLGSDFHSR